MPSSHDAIHTWTAGAQRVWAAAQRAAAAASAENIAVEHLLWGLLSEESRAAEQLERAGITRESLPAAWGASLFNLESGERRSDAPAPLPRHDVLEAVLIEARMEAFQEGPDVELGTEHLLIGLCRVPSDVSAWLNQFDVPETLRRKRAAERPNESDAPTTVPEELPMRWEDSPPRDLSDAYRILDAAANRAREGLRVAEDFVRWAWNDGFLARQLKECRHELTDCLRRFPPSAMLSARDAEGDVGTTIQTAGEFRRESLIDVATAGLRRTEEALRSLEEYGKLFDAAVARRLERLRYRLYTIDKSVHTTNDARSRLADQKLCLLVTESLCRHGIEPTIRSALEAGVRMIQLREKSLPDRQLVELARRVRDWTREFEAVFIVNDRADVAALVNADGVHLGQDDLPVAAARRIVGPGKLVGVSTHSIAQARRGVLDGADYLGVGPVFASSTKSFASFPGLELVKDVAAEIGLPWFAIGGVNVENVPRLLDAGADRVAVSGSICGAGQPGQAAAQLLEALKG